MWCRWQCACLAAPDSFAGQYHFCSAVVVFCVFQPVSKCRYKAMNETSESFLFQPYKMGDADGIISVV